MVKEYGAEMTLGCLIATYGGKIAEIAEKMNIDESQVMAWVCGEVPDTFSVNCLAETIGTPLEKIYSAILNTPNLMM